MRLPLSKQIEMSQFSLVEEYRRLKKLFCDQSAFKESTFVPLGQEHISYHDLLEHVFLQWDFRTPYISIEEMMDSLRISDSCFQNDSSEDRLLDYIQFVLNAKEYVEKRIKRDIFVTEKNNKEIRQAIYENSQYIFDHLDAELKKEKSELYVIYKNDIASVVSNQQPELKARIVDYLKIENRNDLERKKEILASLSNDLELQEDRFKSTEFHALAKDTGELLNNAGIRHPLKTRDKLQSKFLEMSESDRIRWYDHTFDMILACMAALPYLKHRKAIKALTESVKDKQKRNT